ncbi:LeuD/DmdB family oxidoreductase small subunit [Halanaeroarchaeum sulfurireducens]|uniref:3-isopropylmalate dehydratase small subunit n=1 Tax=Halanaeroarchaeum sulfurireducens TaxID=1604004 RepID=A0A0F7PAU8_9EURY|nr:3-isopropylmalate dehydratase [Halanaeroarchaeum sulfurireducens]AKH96759.1 3-isopropylmalate dehydratase small subunit [Halanaeroarchaeum sulfurireducens]ALG81161.1 3-isopropylmalate dehydratase small subunit [Halanaeroarchaeum sulfurireducens]
MVDAHTTEEIALKVREGMEMERDLSNLEGSAWHTGDGVSTDLIAPGRYFDLRSDIVKLAEHTLEDADLVTTDEDFMEAMEPGDFVLGGENFGQGSSREHAPAIIEMAGVSAVIAESVARIFYRNCVNVGLPIITCDTSQFDEGDELQVDLIEGEIHDKTKDLTVEIDPLPDVMMTILEDGGLKPHVEEHRELKVE